MIIHQPDDKKVWAQVDEGLQAVELHRDAAMTVAETRIRGRFPSHGLFSNTECTEVVRVLVSDGGSVTVDDERTDLADGDVVTIPAGSKLYWSGDLDLVAICTPPWTLEQHKMYPED